MKRIIFFLVTFLNISGAFCQSNLPDPYPNPPSNANFYYENKGQVIDEMGNLHPEIKYYTEHAFPEIFLANDKISFVATHSADTSVQNAQDTTGRIDLQFLCNKQAKSQVGGKPATFAPCGVMEAFEPSQDYLNYYLPQFPNGITDVRGYARIVYEDAFPNIDVHFYSNAVAMKVYFVIKPGGNPSDIDLLFTGQDSIGYVSNELAMYLGAWKLQFPQAVAYQITPSNNTTVLGWLPTWIHNGNGEVTLGTIGNYNPSEDLVIVIGGPVQQPTGNDNLEWATFYGADEAQNNGRVYVDDSSNLFQVLSEQGNVYMFHVGETYTANSQYNWYLTKFNADNQRQWATYYVMAAPGRITPWQ